MSTTEKPIPDLLRQARDYADQIVTTPGVARSRNAVAIALVGLLRQRLDRGGEEILLNGGRVTYDLTEGQASETANSIGWWLGGGEGYSWSGTGGPAERAAGVDEQLYDAGHEIVDWLWELGRPIADQWRLDEGFFEEGTLRWRRIEAA